LNQLHLYRAHLTHNYKVLRNHLDSATQLIGVVKAGAYGSDALAFALHLEQLGIDRLAVAYTAEGIALRKGGVQCPIMVFYPQFETLEALLQHNLEPVAYSFRILHRLEQLASTPIPLHLKFNTGLNRLGFALSDLDAVLSKSVSNSFSLQSIYSHLAASEEDRPNALSESQIKKFNALQKKCQNKIPQEVLFHLLNSSGIFNYPEYQYGAVRSGLALYGFANQAHWDVELKPVARLTSTVLQIHQVAKGDTVGYNAGWVAPKASLIATLPLGHADGISRHSGHGKTWVTLGGKKAPIVGNVCMDMVMIDVTEIECEEGDEVEFFGFENTAETLAKQAGTIAYELLSNVGPRVERIVHP